jgi:hypothetical protein
LVDDSISPSGDERFPVSQFSPVRWAEKEMEQSVFHGPLWTDSLYTSFDEAAVVPSTGFSEQLVQGVRQLGQPITVLDHESRFESIGWSVGISLDPETGARRGRAEQPLNGYALAQ